MSLIKTNVSNWPSISDFFDDTWLKSRLNTSELLPAVNVSETDKNYQVEMAAPGFRKEDFSVSIENGILNVSAAQEEEKVEEKKNYTRKEFSSKSFNRNFTLPGNVKEDDISAKYKDGVLNITLKKVAEQKAKKKEVVIK